MSLFNLQAVILAGGRGRRLAGHPPKALIHLGNKTLLQWQLELLERHDYKEILLLLGYRAQEIEAACKAYGSSANISYVIEDVPLGTAGAFLAVHQQLRGAVAVLYGDTFVDVDLTRMRACHESTRADATLFVHPNDHPYDSDLVETDEDGRVVAFHPYPHSAEGVDLPNLVSAALYIINVDCLDGIISPSMFDFGKHLFPLLLDQGKHLQAYRSREYIKDAGTPERLVEVAADLLCGLPQARSKSNKVPAVFIDRDGTLNPDPGYISSPEQIQLFPGVAGAIHRLNQSQYLSILVTNQPVVARGATDEAGLKRIHNRLEQMLGSERAYLDAIYYCPHHPDRGFPGERLEYKTECTCRKPATGLIDRAIADLNIESSASWMIGDSFADVELAHRVGMPSILIGKDAEGQSLYPQRPDFEAETFSDAVNFLLDVWPKLDRHSTQAAARINPGDLVLVGGLARSGKSSFASALAWRLRQMQATAEVISLDGWVKPLEQRQEGGTVLDRFELQCIEQVLSNTLDRSAATMSIPLYDRLLRRSSAICKVDIQAEDIVIVEGVVALMLPFKTRRRIVRIFISRNEDRRRECLAADYRARQFDDAAFASLYEERQQDEAPYVLATRNHADLVVQID